MSSVESDPASRADTPSASPPLDASLAGGGTPRFDHAQRELSTDPAHARTSAAMLANNVRASEQANALRYGTLGPGGPVERPPTGHVESHFLKANSPDGQRALWVKHTLLIPTRPDREPVAELWAIAFDQRGRHKLAQKATYPLSAARLCGSPFCFGLPDAELTHGAARGTVGQGDGQLSWDLHFASEEAPFLPFRYPRMYTGSFPRSKSLTPFPDTRVGGSFTAFGQRWQVDGWRGAQGHNWGKSHAHTYAWLHGNVLSTEPGGAPLTRTWVEVLSGRVRLGPVVTPFLSVAGAELEGRLFRFDAARAIVSRKIAVDTRSFGFELTQDGATLRGSFRAAPEQLAGLCYEDPDGKTLACLNSKLASGRITLSYEGRTQTLYTDQAALELGTRRTDHGVALLA